MPATCLAIRRAPPPIQPAVVYQCRVRHHERRAVATDPTLHRCTQAVVATREQKLSEASTVLASCDSLRSLYNSDSRFERGRTAQMATLRASQTQFAWIAQTLRDYRREPFRASVILDLRCLMTTSLAHARPADQHAALMEAIRTQLLPQLRLRSVHPTEPIVVERLPAPWRVLGVGNYTAVVTHPAWDDVAVKVYAPGRDGIDEEIEVYQRLGVHPGFGQCLDHGENFLVLRRLRGLTFWQCALRGVEITESAVNDIDRALQYARARGLNPVDVHAKNVMIDHAGRGVVVDVSDFLRATECVRWDDLKRGYYAVYRPLRRVWKRPLPEALLNLIRRGYRRLRSWRAAKPSAFESARATVARR